MVNNVDANKPPGSELAGSTELQSPSQEENVISILDLLLILAARKGLILGIMLLGGLIAAIVAFRTAPTYTATTVIMPPQQQSSSAAALLGQLGGAAALASQSIVKSPADVYIGILSSRSVAYKLIARFSLKEVYRVALFSDAQKILRDKTSFDSKKYSLIHISVAAHTPTLAATLANAYVDELQEQLGHLAVTEASQRRLFFERQLEREKKNLAEAEANLKMTQELKGIFQVDSQVDMIIQTIAQIRAEIAAREVSLQRLKAGATLQNPEVQRQEIELKALQNQLSNLEANTTRRRIGDPFMPTTLVPSAGLEYVQRMREVKYRESLFELFAKQYEAARIDEAKESQVIQILDQAIPPDRKSAPVRRNYVIMGIFLGAMVGIFLVFLANAGKNLANNPKLSALKNSLWINRRKEFLK